MHNFVSTMLGINSVINILPGGYQIMGGLFTDLGKDAYLWTASPKGEGYAWYIHVNCNSSDYVSNVDSHKMSVRCIKNP